jgi:guanine deaminase
MTHQDWLQRSIELACANLAQGGGPFGALIVRNGEPIAESGNRVTAELDPSAHAEIQAIRLACQKLQDFQLNDCILYSSCEPCPMCLGAAYWARVAAIYFTADRNDAAEGGFDDSDIYQELALPMQQRRIITQCIALPNAAEPFRQWQNLSNKIAY